MPIDTHQLQSLISILGANTLARVRQSYLEDSEPKLAQLKHAIDGQQFSEVEQISHSLKSASANMALGQLAAIFAEMEQQSAQGKPERLSDLYLQAEECYWLSVQALKDFF